MSEALAWAAAELAPELVKRRIATARRNGFAAWLWPGVEAASWRSALQQIVSVTRDAILANPAPRLVAADGKALCIAAYTSGMGPLLGHWIEAGIIEAENEVAEIMRLHLAHNRRRMARLTDAAEQAVFALGRTGMNPLVLKGMHTAFRFFPEPGARPMSDIDLYIPSALKGETARVFSELGYQGVPRARSPYACDWVRSSARREPKTLTFVHEEDPWSIDVLGSLDKRLATGARVRFDGLLNRAALADWPGRGPARVMQQPLLALYLAVHLSQTLLNATVLRVVELALVLRRDAAEGALKWNEFVHDAGAIGGARFVYPALAFVEQLVPGTIPNYVMQAATNDAPAALCDHVAELPLAAAQPLDRHSVRERFMWAANWRDRLTQIAGEVSLDGRGAPLRAGLHSVGTKLWALRRGRYSA